MPWLEYLSNFSLNFYLLLLEIFDEHLCKYLLLDEDPFLLTRFLCTQQIIRNFLQIAPNFRNFCDFLKVHDTRNSILRWWGLINWEKSFSFPFYFHLNKTSEDAFIYGLLVSSELKFGSLRQLCANTELIVLCQTQYCPRIYTISNRLFFKVEKCIKSIFKIKFIKYGKIEWFT